LSEGYFNYPCTVHTCFGSDRPKKNRNKKQLRLGWAGPRPSQPNLFWAKVCLTKYVFISISFILFSFCVDILLN
jgi:hypothetical protein